MASDTSGGAGQGEVSSGGQAVVLFLAWLAVGIPLLWGVAQTVRKAAALFR